MMILVVVYLFNSLGKCREIVGVLEPAQDSNGGFYIPVWVLTVMGVGSGLALGWFNTAFFESEHIYR